jgi:hypothetical protein
VLGGSGVIDDGEPGLLRFQQPRSPADDLLELHHRVNRTRQHDVLAGGNIHAGAQQPRCCNDHRRSVLRIAESAESASPFRAFLGNNPLDVGLTSTAKLLDTVGQFAFQGFAHPVGM